jgi:hypothetical protein
MGRSDGGSWENMSAARWHITTLYSLSSPTNEQLGRRHVRLGNLLQCNTIQ